MSISCLCQTYQAQKGIIERPVVTEIFHDLASKLELRVLRFFNVVPELFFFSESWSRNLLKCTLFRGEQKPPVRFKKGTRDQDSQVPNNFVDSRLTKIILEVLKSTCGPRTFDVSEF